jgi:succinate dehydrogenase flavin-adding protein (antitoxin of CptAB toxin-antitoxin module)
LQQSDQLLQSLQWDAQRGRQLLEAQFQLSSRQQLNDEQLLQFNMLLEEALMQNNAAS